MRKASLQEKDNIKNELPGREDSNALLGRKT